MENKWERRDKKNKRPKHIGAGASHTREIAPEETLAVVRKAKAKKGKKK